MLLAGDGTRGRKLRVAVTIHVAPHGDTRAHSSVTEKGHVFRARVSTSGWVCFSNIQRLGCVLCDPPDSDQVSKDGVTVQPENWLSHVAAGPPPNIVRESGDGENSSGPTRVNWHSPQEGKRRLKPHTRGR